MAQPNNAAKILDAFIDVLVDGGERAATIDAVASVAGVSKGGVLHHYRSKDALVEGLIGRLRELADTDLAAMAIDPDGPAVYFVRTSDYRGTPLDRAIVATQRLSQGTSVRAARALQETQKRWMDMLEDEVGSTSAARAIMMIGDGLYYNAGLFKARSATTEREMRELLEVVKHIVAYSPGA